MFKEEEGEGGEGGGKKMCVYRAYGLSPRLKILNWNISFKIYSRK